MKHIQQLASIAPVAIVAALAIAMLAGYFPGSFEELPIAAFKRGG